MLSRFLIFIFIVMTTSTFAQIPPIEAGVPQTLAKWRAANYSDVRYKLNLTLEKMSPVLKGTIEISVKNNADQIILDWRKIRGKEDLSKVSNVFLNGKPAKYGEIDEHLVFKDGVTKGKNVIKLDFTSPIATSGAAITRYVDKEDGAEYVYSLFVPSDASTAFPVFDQPDLKARFTLGLSIPPNWKAVSNGIQFMLEEAGKCEMGKLGYCPKTISFEETQPISTYVFAFAAGDFEQFNERNDAKSVSQIIKEHQSGRNVAWLAVGRDFRAMTGSYIFVRKSQAEKFKQHAAEVFRLNREGVKFLESYFDYKFPFPKYDLVLIPEFPFGGMEHAGATFLRESSVIFPTEPTKNDYVSRANVIFHEVAHQWFGDTVTMKWFDDLWLKEGFAEFMAYKTLEKVMPEYNAWKIFYERNKQAAYLTDSTKGTTPIYQEIPNLSAAKSAYGNIVYRKAPSFLRQAEFYLGEDKFQTAVRAFLKKHEFANAEWTDLVKEFETSSKQDLKDWANIWVKQSGLPTFSVYWQKEVNTVPDPRYYFYLRETTPENNDKEKRQSVNYWKQKLKILVIFDNGLKGTLNFDFNGDSIRQVELIENNTINSDGSIKIGYLAVNNVFQKQINTAQALGNKANLSIDVSRKFIFPNYQDYGYGIFLLDEQSRAYVLGNIQNEKDDFLRTMMWGALWDSVRETELAPKDYVELVIKNLKVETDESTIQTLLGRVSTAMNYYLPDAQSKELAAQLETLLIEKMQNASSLGQRITFYRAFLNIASTDKAKQTLKDVLSGKFEIKDLKLKTKDRFDIATKLLIIGDKNAPNLLAELEKTETSDEAKRYAYAAKAGIATAENKQKFFNDFVGNKEISESYIESAFLPFNSTRHADLTLPFLEKALVELPNLKRNRKIFFVNGWLSAFIGGQKSEQALEIVNKFLTDNPNLDRDLRLKVLEVADNLERAVKIRAKYK